MPLNRNANRHAILVAFYNTSDPISAILLMARYQLRLVFDIPGPNGRIDWRTFLITTILLCTQIGIIIGSLVAGVLVPTKLFIGNVAPVNPNVIYVPKVVSLPPQNSNTISLFERSAALRALVTVDYARESLKKKVKFDVNLARNDTIGRPQISFDYAYNLTGYDFGLQRVPSLLHIVTGHCETQYDWYQPGASTQTQDTYWLWGNSSMVRQVEITPFLPAYAQFEVHPDSQDLKVTGKSFYSILPQIAGRRIFIDYDNKGYDQWYTAVLDNHTYIDSIPAGRPAIACEHHTSWSYGKPKAKTMFDLRKLVDSQRLNLAPFLIDTVFARQFAIVPSIVLLSNQLGEENLGGLSQWLTYWRRIQNREYNYRFAYMKGMEHNISLVGDLERLVLASYVHSREFLRNTVLLRSIVDTDAIQNAAESEDERVPDEYAVFGVESPEIQTMSRTVLLVIPMLLPLLWICVFFYRRIMKSVHTPDQHRRSQFAALSVGLSSVHLYMYLDQGIQDNAGQPHRRWEGRSSSAPYSRA